MRGLDENPPTIEELAALGPEELAKVLGFEKRVQEAQEAIQKLNGLSGKARKIAEEKLSKMFTPNVYPDDFKWIAEDAEREADPKKMLASEDPSTGIG